MLSPTIVCAFLLIFVTAECFMQEELNKHLCDNNGSFREEFIKCLKEMPKEIQTVLITCGSNLLNETDCEYDRIIYQTCANPGYSRNVSNCVKNHVMEHHKLDFDDHHHHEHNHSDDYSHKSHHEHQEEEHKDHHDHQEDEHKDHDDHQEDEHQHSEDSDDATEKRKDCLGELYASYNITRKET